MVVLMVGALCLAVVVVVTRSGLQRMTRMAAADIEQLGLHVTGVSSSALRKLGGNTIQQTAQSVADQIGVYLAAHPHKTVKDLQGDPSFQRIAVRPVGQTGYTAVQDSDRAINYFHAQPSIVGLDLHTLAEKLPEFWQIMEASLGGQVSSGYYKWREPDGSTREKYMYIATVERPTADGVRLAVAATTYIDEFMTPTAALKRQVRGASQQTTQVMRDQARDVEVRGVTLLLTVALAMAFLLVHLGARLTREHEALRASESKFKALFETAGDAIFLADPESGAILDANPAAAELLGRDLSEIIGMNQILLHPADKLEKYRRKFERHVREGTAADYEAEALRADGSTVPVFISANLLEMGDPSASGRRRGCARARSSSGPSTTPRAMR